MDDKYVVLKRRDWEAASSDDELELEPVTDAVVIRTKDIFAGPVLHTYAGAVQTAIEVIQGTDAQLSSVWIKELEQVRDYFNGRAEEADAVNQKRFPKAPE